jgi:hypothetical protein
MNRLFLKLAFTVMAGGLLYSPPAATQESPTTKKSARVRITQGPELESANDHFAIIRWRSNNPGGSPEHYGVVHYEISNQVEPKPSLYRFPRAHGRPYATDDVLLHG